MPPIRMTREERSTLVRLAQKPTPTSGITGQLQQKFLRHELAIRDGVMLRITAKGRLELLRQRFRSMENPPPSKLSAEDFITQLEAEIAVLNARVVAERRGLASQKRH